MLVPVGLPRREAADVIRAAWDRGMAVAPLDPQATPEEHELALAALRPQLPVDLDVAAVLTTSGTEGEPKAVELTFTGLAVMADAHATEPGDRLCLALPLHRVAGLAVLARAWLGGLPLSFDLDDPAATVVSLVPTQVRRLLASGHDLSRFRAVLVGGGPVPADIAALPNVVTTYGMTETWGGVVHGGRPLPGVEVTLDPDDGEILVRTRAVMRSYRGDDDATAAAFTADGRFRTGDIGGWDAAGDGRLRVVDRKRDLVITGGVNVSPSEVERVLAEHPLVADVAVAGQPDPEWGERVVAYVVPADPATGPPRLDDLRDFARARLSPPKLPREVVAIETVPRSAGGKVLRRVLRNSRA